MDIREIIKGKGNGHKEELPQMFYLENTHDAVTSLSLKLKVSEDRAAMYLLISEMRRINDRLDWIHQDVGFSAELAKAHAEAIGELKEETKP